jgi:hypothetical protein
MHLTNLRVNPPSPHAIILNQRSAPPLPRELWQRIMCYLPASHHMRIWKEINHSISSLLPYQPYWEAALRNRFPRSTFPATNPFEKYKHCHIGYNRLIQGNLETQEFHPYSDKNFSRYQFEMDEPEVPHSLNLGHQYITLLTNGGLLTWFDVSTYEKKGELQFSRDIFSSLASNNTQTPIKEYQERFYLTLPQLGSKNKIMVVVCSESKTLLFSSNPFPGSKNNLDNENFKILGGLLYLHTSDNTIEIHDTSDYSSCQILTNLASEDEEITSFDVDASKSLLHVILLPKDENILEKIATFDLDSLNNGELKKIDEIAFSPDYRLNRATDEDDKIKRIPFNICRMSGNYIQTQQDLEKGRLFNKPFRYMEFIVDFENKKIDNIFFGMDLYHRSFQISEDYLFYKSCASLDKSAVLIYNSHNGSKVNYVSSTKFLDNPESGIIAFSATDKGIALINQTMKMPFKADFIVEVIHLDRPLKPGLSQKFANAANQCTQAFEEKKEKCQIQ